MELICLYSKKYKGFENKLVMFNNKYTVDFNFCNEENYICIKEKSEDHNEEFGVYPNNLSFKLICGKNGAGKTSILEQLINEKQGQYFVLYKGEDDFFFMEGYDFNFLKQALSITENMAKDIRIDYSFLLKKDSDDKLKFNKLYFNHDYSLNKYVDIDKFIIYFLAADTYWQDIDDLNKYNSQSLDAAHLNIVKNKALIAEFDELELYYILKNYENIKELISKNNNIYEFNIQIFLTKSRNSRKKIENISERDMYYEKIIKNIFSIDVKNIIDFNGINNYDKFDFETKMYMNLISSIIYDENFFEFEVLIGLKIDDLIKFCIDFLITKRRYGINYEVYVEIIEYFASKFKNNNQWVLELNDTQERINIYKLMEKNFQFLETFYFVFDIKRDFKSSGEEYLFKYYLTISDILLQQSKNENITDILIIADEIDNHLHPELNRKLIYEFIKLYGLYKSLLLNKKITFIFTTHSPFLLSDVPEINIMNLIEKENNYFFGNSSYKTLANNIGDIAIDTMFLNSNLGEYSKRKIQGILENKSELSINDIKFINLLGDEFLKKMILKRKNISNEKE